MILEGLTFWEKVLRFLAEYFLTIFIMGTLESPDVLGVIEEGSGIEVSKDRESGPIALITTSLRRILSVGVNGITSSGDNFPTVPLRNGYGEISQTYDMRGLEIDDRGKIVDRRTGKSAADGWM